MVTFERANIILSSRSCLFNNSCNVLEPSSLMTCSSQMACLNRCIYNIISFQAYDKTRRLRFERILWTSVKKKNYVHNLLLILLDHCLKRKWKTAHVLMYNCKDKTFFLSGFKWLFASKQASSTECCQRTNLNKSISVSVYKCGADNMLYVCVLTQIRTNISNSRRFKRWISPST